VAAVGDQEVMPLPPLPPGEYGRNAADAQWRAENGCAARLALHRVVDVPFWHAPAGYCRWCGRDLGKRLADGTVDGRRRWHQGCVQAYHELTQLPALQRAVHERAGGRCVDCGPASRLLPTHPRRDGPGYWEIDHQVPLIDGGPHELGNLVPRCIRHHRAKTAEEARRRAAGRRSCTGQLDLEEVSGA
jgi:5-methylcytosine-specific restriction endonuclease McrA